MLINEAKFSLLNPSMVCGFIRLDQQIEEKRTVCVLVSELARVVKLLKALDTEKVYVYIENNSSPLLFNTVKDSLYALAIAPRVE